MAFDKSGKYHMNPHHAKMADQKQGKEGSMQEEATEPTAEAASEGDEPIMMTCPSCGDTFPMEQGLAHNAAVQQPPAGGHGAAPTQPSGSHMMAMSGY